MSTEAAWICERSVDVDVPASFAWHYMTEVRNWNDPPAEFSLEGPFTAGARGTTHMPGRPAIHWTIESIDPGRAYTIRSSLSDRVWMRFHWEFEPLSDRATKVTQRLELCGDDAADYINQVRVGFEPNLEPGMQRIGRMMLEAARAGR